MIGLTKDVLVAMAAIGLLACASGGKSAACAPVPVERRAGLAQVFSECEVDTRAEMRQPAPDVAYVPGAGERCASAEVEFIVDSLGAVVRGSAVALRSTNKTFADAIITSLANARFTPARRQGAAVAQVARHGMVRSSMAVVTAVGRASTQSTRRPTSTPRC